MSRERDMQGCTGILVALLIMAILGLLALNGVLMSH